jgi:hypothetical protein
MICFEFFFCGGGTGVRIYLTLARQILCHLSYTSCLYFPSAGIIGMDHHAWLKPGYILQIKLRICGWIECGI